MTGYRIECSPALFAALDDEVCAGFASAPRGGEERGGVLFGNVAGGVVRIAAFRAVPGGEASFAFGKNEAQLRKTLEEAAADPELAGMTPVGWYRSNTRSGIRLRSADAAACDRVFPRPWEIALVLHPERTGPTRGAFFFRRPEGGAPERAAEFAIPRPGFDIALPGRRPQGQGKWWLGPLAALLLLLPFLAFFEREAVPAGGPGIGLRLVDHAGQLRIGWDRQSRPVLRATSARLEIREGTHLTAVDLGPADLQQGSIYYWRSAETATVRMLLFGPGGEVEESARIAAPLAAGLWPAGETIAEAAAPEASREVPDAVAAPEPPPPAPPPKPRPRTFHLPAPPPRESAAPRPIAAPPQVALQLPGGPAAAPPVAPPPSAPPPPKPELPPAAAPVPRTPASGQIVWTGRLARRGVVHIEDGRASQGHLSGPLPGARARVTVLPGELTAEGLRLYTADARLAGRADPPGPQNGWNRTEYVWDPRRAAQISVLEAPLEQNGWKRMVLRGEERAWSVVVLRWEAQDGR